ncbi:hypothetical protein FRC11_008266 [Ceratobasidium sp. 423]|nr:hypothetical protein FRC11_008266 [Ceratobasidium sp. 423]
MVNSATSATAPVGSTAANPPARYLKEGKWVKITFPDGTEKTVRMIPKPQNIKKCKKIEAMLDFGDGKTFSHGINALTFILSLNFETNPSPPPTEPPAIVDKVGTGQMPNQKAPVTKPTIPAASTSRKRKAQPKPELETETEQPVETPPTKRQKGNAQTKEKSKASGRSNSWAQNCQDEVTQLESASASVNTKKKSIAAAPPSTSTSNAAGHSTLTISATALAAAAASTSEPSAPAPKARLRPKLRPPPEDPSATTSLAAKSEMVDEFDLSKTAQRKTRSGGKKK